MRRTYEVFHGAGRSAGHSGRIRLRPAKRQSLGAAMRPSKQVALLIETSNAYARGLLRGVMAYVREHQPWSLRLTEHGRGEVGRGELAEWQGHGIIARIENQR